MPELPEVEIVRNALSAEILGKIILKVQVNKYNLRMQVTQNLNSMTAGHQICNITRKGKYIILVLSNQYYIIIHLGMSGKLIFKKDYIGKKHNHVIFFVSDDKLLIFHDPRRFGIVILLDHDQYINFFQDFGVDPLSNEFSTDYLYKIFNKKTTNIKSLLMDNKIITGIGNIYSTESLFMTGILPSRSVKDISITECENLICNIKNVLLLSIKNGGSSIKDFISPFGIKGNFQDHLLVYNRAGKLCYKCNNPISMMKQGGRSTFFCSYCQL